jgi:hypothetical protein
MGHIIRRASALIGLTFSFSIIAITIALAQSPQGAQGPLNNPKEGMVVPVPPSGGTKTDGKDAAATDLPGASAQTMPSTISAENAAKDKHPWLDRGTALSADQKQLIYRSIANKLDTDKASKAKIYGVVSEVLPDSVVPQDLPADVTAKIPEIQDLKYVKANNQVLLVNPPNNTVAAVIAK